VGARRAGRGARANAQSTEIAYRSAAISRTTSSGERVGAARSSPPG
jgi:hypothetical protein